MRKLLHLTGLLAFCFAFSGCPYETEVPLDVPAIKINPALLGTWKDHANSNEIYTVTKQDEFTYAIVKTQTLKAESENYLAYASVVNKTTFLNIWENRSNEKSHPFILFKMEVHHENQVVLTEVTENIDEKFTSSEALRKFVAANMKNSYFFGKEAINLVRSEP